MSLSAARAAYREIQRREREGARYRHALVTRSTPWVVHPHGVFHDFLSYPTGPAHMAEREELAGDVTEIMDALFEVMKTLPDE